MNARSCALRFSCTTSDAMAPTRQHIISTTLPPLYERPRGIFTSGKGETSYAIASAYPSANPRSIEYSAPDTLRVIFHSINEVPPMPPSASHYLSSDLRVFKIEHP